MIKYPESNSEIEVQFWLHSDLCLDGFEVRAEVHGGSGVRFDLVIFRGDSAVAIIEVKKGHYGWTPGQKEKYEEAANGIPVFIFNESSNYKKLVADLDSRGCRSSQKITRDPCMYCGDRYALLYKIVNPPIPEVPHLVAGGWRIRRFNRLRSKDPTNKGSVLGL